MEKEKELYKYAKVPYEIAKELGFANIRKRVGDGMVILNQSDLIALDGETIEKKVNNVEGVLLTEIQAITEIKNPYAPGTDETNKESETINEKEEKENE